MEARLGAGRDGTGAGQAAEAGSDGGGFERFFRSQYPVVVRIAAGVVRDQDLAEDVAQDVLIAAERRFPDLDRQEEAEHAARWVRTAAVHVALNAIRSRRRRDVRHRVSGGATTAAGPEEVLVDREAEAQVREALGRLPLHSATVLLLRHSGLSYVEVAEAMGVKPGNVGTMLRRAEAALRKEVGRATRS